MAASVMAHLMAHLMALACAASGGEGQMRMRIHAVGDVMLGTAVPQGFLPPDAGEHLLGGVAQELAKGDLTFINLEGPLCDSGTSTKCRRAGQCYAFRMPTAAGRLLAEAGVDLASTANNHAGDFGEACRRETEATLDSLNIAWSGPRGTIGRLTAKGKRVALVAFHASTACNDVNDIAAAVALVKQAATDSDFVIVSFHGGAEGRRATRVLPGMEKYLGERRGNLRAFAHAVVDAGADIVLGHGPHVLRAMEIYRGHLIAYSLGNFATYGRFDLSGPLGVSVILEATLDEGGRFVEGRVVSTKQTGKGIPEFDDTLEGAELVRVLSQRDFPATAVRVDAEGRLSAP